MLLSLTPRPNLGIIASSDSGGFRYTPSQFSADFQTSSLPYSLTSTCLPLYLVIILAVPRNASPKSFSPILYNRRQVISKDKRVGGAKRRYHYVTVVYRVRNRRKLS